MSFAVVMPDGSWLSQIKPLSSAKLVVVPDETHQPLVEVLKAATNSIQMSIYHLTDPEIIAILKDAAARFISVQVIYDSSSLKLAKYKDIADQLEKANVQVIPSSPGFSITHTKYFIVDKKIAFISTMNFVEHFSLMRDYGVFVKDAKIIFEMLSVFNSDIANANSNSAQTPILKNPYLVWSPSNSEEKLVELIQSAEKNIYLQVENIGQQRFVSELQNAMKRGVHVQILVPACNLGTVDYNYAALYQLAKLGAEVRLTVPPPNENSQHPYMHAKTILVDNEMLFLGSENFSYNSLNKARELGIVLNNKNIIQEISKVSLSDWDVAMELPAVAPSCSARTIKSAHP